MDEDLKARLVAAAVTFTGGTVWILVSAWGHALLHLLGIQHGF